MSDKRIVLLLADQLGSTSPALRNATPGTDVILMAEVAEETTYVRHNRHKIVLLFSAMRHFAQQLRERGFDLIYFTLDEGVDSLLGACQLALAQSSARSLLVCSPGEFRLKAAMETWQDLLGVEVEICEDTRYLCDGPAFEAWARGRKQLRMEYFYRELRKRYRILMDEDGPTGGRWNFDAENRQGWRGQTAVPERPTVIPDRVTQAVIDLVKERFPDNPGDLDTFRLAVTPEDAEAQFLWFCDNALENFGTFQDALAEESDWLFHSLISMYLNCGLLEPLYLCREVESRFQRGACSLASAEGFIRQILGWREYVRGIYWLHMPAYKHQNHLAAQKALPEFFWTADTELRCLQQALRQSLDLGYAHHIQRLMVIGNFALLAGLDVEAVCDWYLAVYVDAYEWVELPNTLGMALYGDGGIMASKPYAASGKYLQKQGNHCSKCRYSPNKQTGEDACPYNSLYWHFIDRHSERLASNPRMGLILGNWRKRDEGEKRAITAWAEHLLSSF